VCSKAGAFGWWCPLYHATWDLSKQQLLLADVNVSTSQKISGTPLWNLVIDCCLTGPSYASVAAAHHSA
jgi:hypothetical protein